MVRDGKLAKIFNYCRGFRLDAGLCFRSRVALTIQALGIYMG